MIKKIVVLILVLFSYAVGIAQSVTARSSSVVTVMDSRLFAQYNFRPPVFPDTTAANVQKGLDSCGALIFTYDYNGYWYRACSPKRWVKVGITTGGDTAYVSSRQLTPNTFVLCRGDGRCDTISIATQGMTALVSGSAIWSGTDLDYNVTNCVYYILGGLYNSSATTVTLDPADPSNPRIDVIYLDTSGNVGVITGMPSPDPIKPVVDPLSQIELTHINLSAGSVSPPGITTQLVYNENLQEPIEWNTSNAVGILDTANFNYLINPYRDLKSTFVNEAATIAGDFSYKHSTPISTDTCTYLSMYLRLNSLPSSGTVVITPGGRITSTSPPLYYIYLLRNGEQVAYLIGGVDDGNYGYSESLSSVGQYQLIAIPMSDFIFKGTPSHEFDEIEIIPVKDVKLGIQFDYINLQFGGNVPPITSNYWSLSGNDVSSIPNSKLGTTSNDALSIVTNDVERINIAADGLVTITDLQTYTSQDTTTYKPVGVNSAGEITKMDSWVGGAIPNLQQVTDVGNITTTPITITSDLNNSIGQINKLHISDVDNLFFMDSATIDFRADYSIGNSYSDIILGTHYYPSVFTQIYADQATSFTKVQNSLGYTLTAGNDGLFVGDWLGNQINVRNNAINFTQSSNNNINYYPIYPTDSSHICYLPQTIPTQLTDTIATLRDIRAGGGGSGTVTSISQGYGISNSPNPITTAGTISVDTVTLSGKYLRIVDTTNKWVSSVTKVNDSTIRVVKDGTTNDLTFTTATNATRLVTQVWNSTGATITRGSVIYINGAHSSILPSIALAKANQESTSAFTYGLVINDISDNSEGTVIQNGAITNLNLPTTSYTDGQTLYLSPTVAGGYTTTKPTAPNHYVAIGTVTRAHPVFGTIQVAIRNGFQLDEMSDVQIPQVPNDSTLLQFSRVDSLWHAVSPTNAIGTRYIKPSDTASMLANYGRKDYNTLSVVLNNGNTATDKTLQLTASTTQAGYMTTKTSSARGSLFNNRLSIEDLSGNSNYTYLDIDTSTNDPYLMIHQNSSLKECRVYSNNIDFKNLTNGSIVTINAPTSTSNRTINIQDASGTLMLTGDTASLSSRIDTKTNLSQSAYTFLANNTNAPANMSTQVFNDQGSQTYTGTITWGSANPPTGTTNHSYRWTQVGKMVTLSIQLVYGTASTGTQTSVTMTLPTGLPSPNIPSGLASGDVVYHGTGSIYNTSNTMPTTTSFVVGMFSDGTIRINRISAGTSRYASATVTYWTN